jgi:hypothetical protein
MANDITKSLPPFDPSLANQTGLVAGKVARSAVGAYTKFNDGVTAPVISSMNTIAREGNQTKQAAIDTAVGTRDQLKQGWDGAVAGYTGVPLAQPAPAAVPAPVKDFGVATTNGWGTTPAAAPAPIKDFGVDTTNGWGTTPEIHADNVQPGSLWNAYQQGKTAGNPAQAAAPAGTFTPQKTSFGNNAAATSGDYKGMTQNEINSGWAHKNMVLDAQLALQNPSTSDKERQMYMGMIAGEMQGYNHSQDANTQANAQKYGADRSVDVANIHSGDSRYATDASVENTNTTNSAHIYGIDSAANTAAQQLQLAAADSLGKRQVAAQYNAEYLAASAKGEDALQKFYIRHGVGGKSVVLAPIGSTAYDAQTGQPLNQQLPQPR